MRYKAYDIRISSYSLLSVDKASPRSVVKGSITLFAFLCSYTDQDGQDTRYRRVHLVFVFFTCSLGFRPAVEKIYLFGCFSFERRIDLFFYLRTVNGQNLDILLHDGRLSFRLGCLDEVFSDFNLVLVGSLFLSQIMNLEFAF